MIIAGTGHRPSKIGGFSIPNPTYNYICKETEKILLQEKPDKVITGMALGFDTILANTCIKIGIPFIAAIPFKGQENYWPTEARDLYYKLLSKAEAIEVVCPGGFASWKMQVRNQWLVNRCDLLVACFNNDTYGGTYNCIKYAKEHNKKIIFINPKNIK